MYIIEVLICLIFKNNSSSAILTLSANKFFIVLLSWLFFSDNLLTLDSPTLDKNIPKGIKIIKKIPNQKNNIKWYPTPLLFSQLKIEVVFVSRKNIVLQYYNFVIALIQNLDCYFYKKNIQHYIAFFWYSSKIICI